MTAPAWLRYSIAAGLGVACTFARVALDGYLHTQAPFITFYIGTVIAARYLGTGPAISTPVLGGLATSFFFIQPQYSFAFGMAADAVWLALYAFVCATIIWAIDAQRQARALAESRYESLLKETTERERAQAAEERTRRHAMVTLSSIGDAVISTDAEGKIAFLNAVAERLTGWTEGEARGRPVEDVFRIYNESTNQPAEIPVRRVLETGRVQGLANHTILVAKNGARTPSTTAPPPFATAAEMFSAWCSCFATSPSGGRGSGPAGRPKPAVHQFRAGWSPANAAAHSRPA